MEEDLVARLRASELPEDRQYQREARVILHALLNEAADALEAQEKFIQELEDELQVAVVVHKKLEEQIDAFEMDAGHAAARIKELEERIAFMEASAAPEKTIDILIK